MGADQPDAQGLEDAPNGDGLSGCRATRFPPAANPVELFSTALRLHPALFSSYSPILPATFAAAADFFSAETPILGRTPGQNRTRRNGYDADTLSQTISSLIAAPLAGAMHAQAAAVRLIGIDPVTDRRVNDGAKPTD